jgi:hypothetical protein
MARARRLSLVGRQQNLVGRSASFAMGPEAGNRHAASLRFVICFSFK